MTGPDPMNAATLDVIQTMTRAYNDAMAKGLDHDAAVDTARKAMERKRLDQMAERLGLPGLEED